jgi:hypothetical protein
LESFSAWPNCCAHPDELPCFYETWWAKERIIVARLRKSEINFLWLQLGDVIEHGKNKDAKTKLELMRRIYQFLAKTMPKDKPAKKSELG